VPITWSCRFRGWQRCVSARCRYSQVVGVCAGNSVVVGIGIVVLDHVIVLRIRGRVPITCSCRLQGRAALRILALPQLVGMRFGRRGVRRDLKFMFDDPTSGVPSSRVVLDRVHACGFDRVRVMGWRL
jgi:hypothetical protein